MKKSSSSGAAPFFVFISLLILFICFLNRQEPARGVKEKEVTEHPDLLKSDSSLPVIGSQGQRIMFEEDGVYLRTPDGDKKKIANTPEELTQEEAVEKRIREKIALTVLNKKQRNVEPGVLIVLDRGIVEIPKESVIVYQDANKLTCINQDGSVSSYYADGKIVTQENSNRLRKN